MGRRWGMAFFGGLLVSVLAFGATAVAAPSANAGSFTTAKVKAAGVSLQYPSSWTVRPFTTKAVNALAKRLRKKSPKLAQALESSEAQQSTRGTKFFAIDLDALAAGRPGSDVQVALIANTQPPKNISDVDVGYSAADFAKIGGMRLGISAVRVENKQAYRIDARVASHLSDGTTRSGLISELLIVVGQSQVVFVNVAAPDDADGAKLIDGILASVRRI
jgi:hypothetical protein